MTTNPREASYLLHLKEAEEDFRRQLQSGAFGDLMREAKDIDLDDRPKEKNALGKTTE